MSSANAVAVTESLGLERLIRFKEWGPYTDKLITPKTEYIQTSDGSLDAVAFRVRTDAEGFLQTGNELANPGGMRKVVMLGGSFVESLFVHEQQRFASILERKLQGSELRFQCWNGGYSGSTLLHSFNVFMNKVIPQTAYVERVLIFTAMSDLRTLTRKRSYWARDKTHAPVLEDRNGSAPADRDPSTEQMEPLLRTFIAAARNFGQEPIIVGSPFRDGDYEADPFMERMHGNRETYDSAQEQMRMINRAAKNVALAEGATFVDAEAALHGRFDLFYDTMHLNVAGQEVMADFLFKELSTALHKP